MTLRRARAGSLAVLLLAAGCGLELPSASDEKDKDDEKGDELAGDELAGDEVAPTTAETNAILAARGFAVLNGDYKRKDGETYDCPHSRFVVTALDPQDTPVVPVSLSVKLIDRGSKDEDFKVRHKGGQLNKRSNVFTVVRCAGSLFEFTLTARGFAPVNKIVEFPDGQQVDVAFPINFLEKGADVGMAPTTSAACSAWMASASSPTRSTCSSSRADGRRRQRLSFA